MRVRIEIQNQKGEMIEACEGPVKGIRIQDVIKSKVWNDMMQGYFEDKYVIIIRKL